MMAVLTRSGGGLVIAFGLVQMGVLKVPWLQQSFELPVGAPAAPGYARSFLVGATYSLGWTPCIGPVLGAILTSAVVFGDPWQGAFLLFAFALGLAIPPWRRRSRSRSNGYARCATLFSATSCSSNAYPAR